MALLLTFFSVLLLVSAGVAYLIATPSGGRQVMDYLLKQYASVAMIDVGHSQGTILKGFVLKSVQLTGLPYIPNALVRIQQMRAQVVLWPAHLDLDVFNARVFIPPLDPIVFSGRLVNGQLTGELYAHAVDVHAISRFCADEDLRKNLRGFVTDIDLHLTGPVSTPRLSGRLFVDRIQYKATVVSDGFGRVDFTMQSPFYQPQIKGEAVLDSGLVTTRHIAIDLTESKVRFEGDLANPALDIHAGASVDNVDINLSIKGTLQKPKLLVSSDPPLPEDVALLVLATGKRHSALSSTGGLQGTLSGQLVNSFLNYFLLDDQSGAYAQTYGLSNAGLEDDFSQNQNRFGLTKSLTDDLKVGVELEQMPSQVGEPTGYARKLEGEMDVTNHLSFNVFQRILSEDRGSYASSDQNNPQPRETQFYLQYKEKF